MKDDGIWFQIEGRDRLIELGILPTVKLLNSKNITTIGSCEGHGDMAWIQIKNTEDYSRAQKVLKENDVRYIKILNPKYNGMCSKIGIYWDGLKFIDEEV